VRAGLRRADPEAAGGARGPGGGGRVTSVAEAQPRETPFTDAAQFYAPFRPPYAPEALDHATARLGLTRDSRALDLGCGPGTLSIPLSRRVGEVVAVDIDPRMLACARDAAVEAD